MWVDTGVLKVDGSQRKQVITEYFFSDEVSGHEKEC